MTPAAAFESPVGHCRAALMFLGFAAMAYFLSALLRAVVATLAPLFSLELGLTSADLGLLAGAYFLGFASLQLPLGYAMDAYGPKRVVTLLLLVAVIGCVGFATAESFPGLIASRTLIGVGAAACFMATLTCFRRHLSMAAQLRANSWMLMTGSLGIVDSTVPVQILVPVWGWRGLFLALAAALGWAILLIRGLVPPDSQPMAGRNSHNEGYRQILFHPLFKSLAPLEFFAYGGMIAIQALWAGPWLTRVSGWSASEAAQGLFVINCCMLVAFLTWGSVMPWLARRGVMAGRLMTWGLPISLLTLEWIAMAGRQASAWSWAIWCVSSTFVSLSQPALGQAFPLALAGRALSAFNLVIFAGVFSLQWGIGLVVDGLLALGLQTEAALQLTFAGFAGCCLVAYAWLFVFRPRDFK